MSLTPSTFRTACPEFSDAVAYPDAQIAVQITSAALQMNPASWGALLDYGTQLFVAHKLALGRRRQRTAKFGGVPGEVTGPVASKGADKLSKSYDTGAVTFDGAGDWNATEYGVEYFRLSQLVGAGGAQIS